MLVDESLVGERAPVDITDPKTGEVLIKKGRKINKLLLRRMVDMG